MRISHFTVSVVSLLFFNFFALLSNSAEAKNTLDLTELPSIKSALANKSVIMDIIPNGNSILAVGERGHIINWKNDTDWQQEQAPVSVAITSVTGLSDGSRVAVGHDGIIIKADPNSDVWRKVFTGVQLTKLKIALLQKQSKALQLEIEQTQDEDKKEDLTYQLDDINFGVEDSQLELKSGANKPLLSITTTSNDTLFATGAYGTLLTSIDKGESWRLISDRLKNPDNYHLNAVIATSNDQLYIVGENGRGFSSQDLGETWSVMNLPYSGSLFGLIANIKNGNTQLVAFGLQGHFMISNDGGAHWITKKLPTSASLLGGEFSKQGQAYLVGHGGLIVSFNLENIDALKIEKHPSGAALSSVVVKEDSLILAGQFGILSWSIRK